MEKSRQPQTSVECKITTTIILALIPLERMTRRKTARVTEISQKCTLSTYEVKRLSNSWGSQLLRRRHQANMKRRLYILYIYIV